MTVVQAPKLETFSLRTQLLSSGRTDRLVAESDDMWMHMKVHAAGGENDLHQHPNECHAFVVLGGQATFYDGDETPTVVHQYEGAFVRKGAYYRFSSSGDEPLVMLRIGSGINPYHIEGLVGQRFSPDGTLAVGKLEDKTGQMPVIPIPGKFFGD
jgi:mannose-6-phosphate isomerase-like protein (cupin superfamily)